MAGKEGHRRFGSVRRLPSGRYQARYRGPDGRIRNAPQTYARKSDAERALTLIEAQLVRGEWTDPARGRVHVSDYASAWIGQRPGLRPRTVDLYRWLLGKHIVPRLGGVQLGKLDTEMIRVWRANLLAAGVSESVAAKAYRLLRAVLMTAVDDGILVRNPCRLRGAGTENAPERPVLTVAQVYELADAMKDRRFRALVLLATFASLRWGEAVALRRSDIDLTARTVRVRRTLVERYSGDYSFGPPKSRAGARTVNIPASVVGALREHLTSYTGTDDDALAFPGAKGGPIRRRNFNKMADWSAAVEAVGVPELHFHDLRHTGNMLAARTGAGLRDLMRRMGHDNVRAALIYQHATSDADRRIADALDADAPANGPQDDGDGPAGVPAPAG